MIKSWMIHILLNGERKMIHFNARSVSESDTFASALVVINPCQRLGYCHFSCSFFQYFSFLTVWLYALTWHFHVIDWKLFIIIATVSKSNLIFHYSESVCQCQWNMMIKYPLSIDIYHLFIVAILCEIKRVLQISILFILALGEKLISTICH